MICEIHWLNRYFTLMFIISYHNRIKCLSNLLQLATCYVIFKVISDMRCEIQLLLQLISGIERNHLYIDVYLKLSLWYKMS